jgi:hypothetical protein
MSESRCNICDSYIELETKKCKCKHKQKPDNSEKYFIPIGYQIPNSPKEGEIIQIHGTIYKYIRNESSSPCGRSFYWKEVK